MCLTVGVCVHVRCCVLRRLAQRLGVLVVVLLDGAPEAGVGEGQLVVLAQPRGGLVQRLCGKEPRRPSRKFALKRHKAQMPRSSSAWRMRAGALTPRRPPRPHSATICSTLAECSGCSRRKDFRPARCSSPPAASR